LTEAEWMIFAAGCLGGGTVGYVVGIWIAWFRAARASSRTIRNRR
jgi:hypothetical protein